ncbi:MAG: NAD(P)H-dependent oxidoreductase [Desulfuromonadales bacterium]|nr:NAD(P)H-dependent oxidoreductase [Desulfuromonadales bacterium]MBN2792553.1 NAD(P)H-dependent oxidoreductase [Desulfuromonadales bacterium]
MKKINILGICGSLRNASTNMGLLRYAQENAPQDISITIADLSEIPFFNADLTEKPAAVETLLHQFAQADAFLFACPEYNYSFAPALKNALDWASRADDNRLLAGKPAALLGSGGGMGSARAQYHLRQVCVFLDIPLLNKPEIFCNAFAGSFAADGRLVDEKIQGLIDQQLAALGDLTRRLS